MSWYGGVFAFLYDPFVALSERRGMADLRHEVVSQARGDVLEVGAGTGLNLLHYPDAATRVILADPEAPMVRRLRERARSSARTEVVQAPAERLPFHDAQFDTVVCTFVLCTVADMPAALGEITRVLRPDGQLRLRAGRWSAMPAIVQPLIFGPVRPAAADQSL